LWKKKKAVEKANGFLRFNKETVNVKEKRGKRWKDWIVRLCCPTYQFQFVPPRHGARTFYCTIKSPGRKSVFKRGGMASLLKISPVSYTAGCFMETNRKQV